MDVNKEGIYLALLLYQIVMTLTIWVETAEIEHVQQFRIERLKLTAGTITISLLTSGGYFITEGNRWAEWIVGLLIFSLTCLLTFKLVDCRKTFHN